MKPLLEDGKGTGKVIKHFNHFCISVFKSPPRKFCLLLQEATMLKVFYESLNVMKCGSFTFLHVEYWHIAPQVYVFI